MKPPGLAGTTSTTTGFFATGGLGGSFLAILADVFDCAAEAGGTVVTASVASSMIVHPYVILDTRLCEKRQAPAMACHGR
jgi:hypothetical protein